MINKEKYKCIIVVPCYNEASRWDFDAWNEKLALPGIFWIFVNDGSTDHTNQILKIVKNTNAEVINLPDNIGKGETVRFGMLEALKMSSSLPVGFMDADNAFTKDGLVQIVTTYCRLKEHGFSSDDFDTVWASRMKLAGRKIKRHLYRHIAGRFVSLVLRAKYGTLPFDTQAGLKIFENSPELRKVLEKKFATRWLFEIEIVHRWQSLNKQPMRIWEEPVIEWIDIPGSKVSGNEIGRIVKELSMVLSMKK